MDTNMPPLWSVSLINSQVIVSCPFMCCAPHYVVGAENVDGDEQFEMANDLCAWLNGEQEPNWLMGIYRIDDRSLRTMYGNTVESSGPFYYDDETAIFEENEGDDRIDRGLLIDAIIFRQRKLACMIPVVV